MPTTEKAQIAKDRARQKKIPVMEMFGPTFQGEGAEAGVQTYFIRFGLCDYECKMCDSLHAVLPKSVKELATWETQDEIFERFRALYEATPGAVRHITFSGGNPCIHDLTHLVERLRALDFVINVETQGTKSPAWLKDCNLVTCSPKGPGMGEDCKPEVLLEFVRKNYSNMCMKCVVFDQRDLEFANECFQLARKYGVSELYLSLGNPYPPGSDNEKKLWQAVCDSVEDEGARNSVFDGRLKLTLLEQYTQQCEELLADGRFPDVRFFPQMHVLAWANKAEV